jgi:hypothetical protein
MSERPENGGTAPRRRPGRRKDDKRDGGYRPARTPPEAVQPPPDLTPPQTPQSPQSPQTPQTAQPPEAPAPAPPPPAGSGSGQ